MDVSFEIDPNPLPNSGTQCEYKTIDRDVTNIATNNIQSRPTTDVINHVMADADTHLQKGEKGKWTRANKTYEETNTTVKGEDILGEMLKNMNMIIPMAIDGHGSMGPLMMIFLFGTCPKNKYRHQLSI